MDPALIARCADPSLKPAVVETFLASVGSPDPLAVTVVSGGRLMLLPKPADTAEAISLVRRYAGHAVVRVGLTQMPAGLGARQVDDIDPNLFDDCTNVRRGSALFAKVMRIVARWYGNPQNDEGATMIFEDASQAWKTGFFEGTNVFVTADPGRDLPAPDPPSAEDPKPEEASPSPSDDHDIGRAGIRIDLSRISGKS